MKKVLFLASLAAIAMTSCTSESNEYVGNGPEQKEIAFMPLTQPVTRAAVEGTVFPSGQDMYVAAYDATKQADFFGQTTFDEDGTSNLWKANPKKFWPLDDATINFLAYTGVPSGSFFNATHPAQSLTITLEDNSSNQYDLMYACGRGTRTRSAAATNVAMNFKHAQALIKFTVQSASDYGTSLKLTSIVLTGAHYSGTFAVTHTGWDDTDNDPNTQAVSGTWSSVGTQANVTRTPSWADENKVTTSAQAVGEGILVVPDDNDATDDYTSFTINYTLDGIGYSYTYTPTDLDVHQAKKYTFAITISMNEIIIAPTVTDFVAEGGGAVPVQ